MDTRSIEKIADSLAGNKRRLDDLIAEGVPEYSVVGAKSKSAFDTHRTYQVRVVSVGSGTFDAIPQVLDQNNQFMDDLSESVKTVTLWQNQSVQVDQILTIWMMGVGSDGRPKYVVVGSGFKESKLDAYFGVFVGDVSVSVAWPSGSNPERGFTWEAGQAGPLAVYPVMQIRGGSGQLLPWRGYIVWWYVPFTLDLFGNPVNRSGIYELRIFSVFDKIQQESAIVPSFTYTPSTFSGYFGGPAYEVDTVLPVATGSHTFNISLAPHPSSNVTASFSVDVSFSYDGTYPLAPRNEGFADVFSSTFSWPNSPYEG